MNDTGKRGLLAGRAGPPVMVGQRGITRRLVGDEIYEILRILVATEFEVEWELHVIVNGSQAAPRIPISHHSQTRVTTPSHRTNAATTVTIYCLTRSTSSSTLLPSSTP
jgi:hypothetical protein